MCAALSLASTLVLVAGCPMCTTNDDCTADAPVCANAGTPAAACVECVEDTDCSAGLCVNNACVECSSDADCDDGNACTSDTCTDGTCTSGDAPDCNDDDACTTDSCDPATGDCVNEAVVCDAGQECDADTGQCVSPACSTDAECDDGLLCTTDACGASGQCEFTAVDCDDSDACTTDSCDAATGDCVSTPVECPTGQTCDADTGDCVATAACTTDADCDDGVFCNGAETCDLTDPANGVCVPGTDPCADTVCAGTDVPTCSEGDTAAVCTCPPTETIPFTLDADNLTGSSGDDTFDAPLIFSSGTGTQIPSLQTGDVADGLAGNDTIGVDFNNQTSAGVSVTPQSLAGIEVFDISDFSGTNTTTLNAINISGATTFNSVNSTQTMTITNLQNNVAGGLNNTATGFAMSFASSVTSGTTDTFSLTLDSVTGGVATITPGATNGFETVSVTSNGGTANVLANFTQSSGTSLVTMNLSGTQNLEMRRTDATVLTFDGSMATGNLTLGSGDGSNASPYSAFHASNANIKQITGGSGDDFFIFGATLDGNDASGTTETIDGGAGMDSLQATLSATIGGVLPIANLERLFFNATATSQVNLTGVTGLESVWIDGANGATTQTITLLNIAGTTLPTLNYQGDNRQMSQNYDAVTYQAAGAGGSGDSLSVTIGNRGTALNSSGTTNGHTIGALSTPQVEILNVTCNDGPCTVTTGITASTLTTLNCTASSNMTVNAVSTGGSDTILTITASAVTGNFTGSSADIGSAASLTFGSGADTFTTNDSSHTSTVVTLGSGNDTYVSEDDNSADVINGGAGTDTITGGGGLDTITGGTGADTFIFLADNVDATDANSISDFTTGSGGDVISLDVSGVAGGIVANLSSANFANGTAAAVAAADNTIIVINDTAYANFTAAETAVNARNAATLDYLVVFLNSTTNVVEVYADADSSSAGSGILLASLTNLTTQSDLTAFLAGNFNTF